MKKFILSLLFIGLSFAENNQEELKKLLAVIQGTFKDKIYTITIEKSKEYLLKAPEDDKYREKVIKILAYTYLQTNKINEFIKLLDYIEKIKTSNETKIYVYKLALSKLPDNKKINLLLKLYKLENKDDYLLAASNILYKNNSWEAILTLPDSKKINHLKVYSLFKLGKYENAISFSQNLEKFENKKLDFVFYYTGLSYLKINDKEKAVLYFEKVNNKDPKLLKFLVDFYIKNKKYKKAENYLKHLLEDKNYGNYALFYMGLINEKLKNYKSALNYYKKLIAIDKNQYKILAVQRILELKAKNLVPKEKYYSIRVILYKKQETATNYIKKHKLKECFIYPYKNFYGIYCGLYLNFKDAKKDLKRFKAKLKVKDILIDKISI